MADEQANKMADEQANKSNDSSEGKSISRRTALMGVAGLGLINSVDLASASSAGSTLEFGGTYSGSPGSGHALDLRADTTNVFKAINTASSSTAYGIQGKSHSTNGRGLVGFATATQGETRGLLGRVESPKGTALFGRAAASSGADAKGGYMLVDSSDDGAVGVQGEATASSGKTYGVKGISASSSGYGLYTPDDAKVDGTMEVGGDLQVSGTKNFVQTVAGDAGPKQVTYTAVEAGDPQTEHSDVAEMEDGVAVVELPDHFGMVTSSEERLTVQVTPYADEKVHPQVTDTSTDRIVVKDFGDGSGDYAFSYTVTGIRQGFEDQDVVRDAE